MQRPTSPSSPRANPEKLLAALETSRAHYTQLLALIRSRRDAIRAADFQRFSQLSDGESRLLAMIAELDRARTDEARSVATRLALPADASLSDIGARLGDVDRARLDVVRSELRPLSEEVRRESGIVRQAAERLSAHMAGILQSVHSALAHANVYSRGGRIAVGANVISSLDIRS